VEVLLLGSLEVLDDAGSPIEIRGVKLRTLLALLALRVGEVVPTNRIIEDLWGEQELQDPLNAVQVVVSKLRRALQVGRNDGAVIIATSTSGYSLDLEPESIDSVRFERHSTLGRQLLAGGDPAAAEMIFSEGLALWRGPALADVLDDDFERGDRTRLDELRLMTIEQRIDAELALGRHDTVIADLERLTTEHPLRERLRVLQMLALYRAGRQADALRAFQVARSYLGDELGLEPGTELQELEGAILRQDPSLDAPDTAIGPRSRSNIPTAISSFIGRADELDSVVAALGSHRLVSIVGPGGAGKTRLTLEVARRIALDGIHTCCFVELAPVSDPDHVAATTASALGLDDARRIDDFVAHQRVLIILDNCEHVLDAAATLAARLLYAGPDVRVLATSREALGVTGEQRWVIPPLSPADASALFAARASDGGMADAGDSPLVTEICDRLDGLPLAVELAAARTRTLSLDDISTRLNDRFKLLSAGDRTAHPRQQTLRNLVDWSYDLLFTDEQRVFRRLSVFAGGFGISAAEAVAAGDDVPTDDIADILAHLVDKSLVTMNRGDGDSRFQLLQTLIDYGRSRLDDHELTAAQDRHLTWIVDLADRAEPALRGPTQREYAAILDEEIDNIRAAVQWALDTDHPDNALAIVANLGYGWYVSGGVTEGRMLLDAVLTQVTAGRADHLSTANAWSAWLTQLGDGVSDVVVERSERAVTVGRGSASRVFGLAAVIAVLVRGVQGRSGEAAALVTEASQALDAEPDVWGRAWVDWADSGVALKLGDPGRALMLLRRGVAGFDDAGDRIGASAALFRLSELAELRGDLDEAVEAATSAYESTIALGTRAFNASTLATRLGNIAVARGQLDEAAAWHARALVRAREGGFPGAMAQAVSGSANAAHRRGDLGGAEEGHREALTMFEASGSIEGVASSLAALGLVANARGDHGKAAGLLHESLTNAARGHDRRAIALALEGLAAVNVTAGDGREAARLLGAASAIRVESGASLASSPPSGVDSTAVGVVELIGPDGLAAGEAEGRGDYDRILTRMLEGLVPVTS
jgi:predicted ATPase/DNA-binding SARP family transcriptional activator